MFVLVVVVVVKRHVVGWIHCGHCVLVGGGLAMTTAAAAPDDDEDYDDEEEDE